MVAETLQSTSVEPTPPQPQSDGYQTPEETMGKEDIMVAEMIDALNDSAIHALRVFNDLAGSAPSR